jgi:hypothetical protein
MNSSKSTSLKPTMMPTMMPTSVPTSMPTMMPTSVPTSVPTSMPTMMPTSVPTSMKPDIMEVVQTKESVGFVGYDGSSFSSLAQEYGKVEESLFPKVKEVKLVELIDIKPFDNSLMGQQAHTVEVDVVDEGILKKNDIGKLDNLDGLKGTDIVYSNISNESADDNLRGPISGYGSTSSFMNYNTFMTTD